MILPSSKATLGNLVGYIKESENVCLNNVRLFVTPWTVAHLAPLSIEFSRQEYWSGLPFLSPVHVPHPGIEPGSLAMQTDSLLSEQPMKIIYIHTYIYIYICMYKECSDYCTITLISHASKVMLKILQARLQQYMN